MTAPAPAAAAASGPIAPVAPRAAPQPPADRFAFAAVLDSLPATPAKAGGSTAEEQAHASNESSQDESSRARTARHSPLNESALLASLPFALRAAAMGEERMQAPDNSPAPTATATTGPKSEDSGGSPAASAQTPAVGRLIGERAFHVGSPTFTGATSGRTLARNAPFAPDADLTAGPPLNGGSSLAAGLSPAEAMPAAASADAVPSITNAASATPVGTRAGASTTHRGSAARAAAHEAASSIRKPDLAGPPSDARASTSAAVHAPAESSSGAADGPTPDTTVSAAPLTPQTGLFGGALPAPFAAATSFQLDGSTASAGRTDVAPRTTTLAAAAATSTGPIKEIDVDLSQGGLEDVSMTMRLAGDKLSVVIRAASSQTLGSIEGARDAIADRMAAIGQPLDSLVVKQMGVNTDGNANGKASSADGGSAGGDQRSAQGASERGGSNNADSSRRGAGRDRSF